MHLLYCTYNDVNSPVHLIIDVKLLLIQILYCLVKVVDEDILSPVYKEPRRGIQINYLVF